VPAPDRQQSVTFALDGEAGMAQPIAHLEGDIAAPTDFVGRTGVME
jgi:hypothetical protein